MRKAVAWGRGYGRIHYPMMSDPKTDPIPAPDPATPTVAAPAPMNLAAESMSLRAAEVERVRLATETGALIDCKK